MDRFEHQSILDAGNDGDIAYLGGQDEVHFTLHCFFIAAKACGQAFGLDALDRWNWTVLVDDAMDGDGIGSTQPSRLFGENGRACIPQAIASPCRKRS